MLAHARHNENGGITNGMPGDQTGHEVELSDYYDRPWDMIIRSQDPVVRSDLTYAAIAACLNDNIGYDQRKRETLYHEAENHGFDPSEVTEKCSTDCSALIAVCAAYAGIMIPAGTTTRTLEHDLISTGKFYAVRERSAIQRDKLLQGDILLSVGKHTAIYV